MDYLEELWYGEQGLCKKNCDDEEYKRLFENMYKHEQYIYNSLSDKDKEAFERFEEALADFRYYTELNAFKAGFNFCSQNNK